mmetsp:Transcript_16077/g.32021  ORF Transcript_16077/g.32021 Transcript_16077/m.32021 type:complete len:80 (-) Transcript_16077:50-289(-)
MLAQRDASTVRNQPAAEERRPQSGSLRECSFPTEFVPRMAAKCVSGGRYESSVHSVAVVKAADTRERGGCVDIGTVPAP